MHYSQAASNFSICEMAAILTPNQMLNAHSSRDAVDLHPVSGIIIKQFDEAIIVSHEDNRPLWDWRD
ncbi:hypothetical protein DL767_000166 [Monosporascus sp. MG133]|nr:hypothetical protein DL767_000166 [Monosporascus sp. MG133]